MFPSLAFPPLSLNLSGGSPAALPTVAAAFSVLMSPSARTSASRSPVTCGFIHDFASMVNNPASYPDLVLLVEGRVVVAHRAVLATRCPSLFKPMLTSNTGFREGE